MVNIKKFIYFISYNVINIRFFIIIKNLNKNLTYNFIIKDKACLYQNFFVLILDLYGY
jgi:hypothetical protein